MPPPVEEMSEDESTGGSIPFDNNAGKEDAPNGNGEDEGEDEEGVFDVEKIMGHEFAKDGTLYFIVKWKGWDKPEDQTMEPEENLSDAQDVVDEYFKVIGGRPQPPAKGPAKGPGRKRKSVGEAKPTPEKTETKKRRKSKGVEATPEGDGPSDWVPKGKGSWENDIERVDTIIRDQDSSDLFVYLNWKNGRKSRVSIETCYDKCPKMMLRFYEKHLVFKEG